MAKQFNGKTVGSYVMYTAERSRGNTTAQFYPDSTFAFGNGAGVVVTSGGTNASTRNHGPVAPFDGKILSATLGIYQSNPTTFSAGQFQFRYFYGGGGFTLTGNNTLFNLAGKFSGQHIVLDNIDRDIDAGHSFNWICTQTTAPTQTNFTLTLSVLVRYDIPYQNEQGYLL